MGSGSAGQQLPASPFEIGAALDRLQLSFKNAVQCFCPILFI
jgi:hypothetical protein